MIIRRETVTIAFFIRRFSSMAQNLFQYYQFDQIINPQRQGEVLLRLRKFIPETGAATEGNYFVLANHLVEFYKINLQWTANRGCRSYLIFLINIPFMLNPVTLPSASVTNFMSPLNSLTKKSVSYVK